MDAADRKQWIRAALIFGAVYFIVNFSIATFAGWFASIAMRATWNRLGFLICAVAFAVHIAYEHFRLCNSPRTTASHVSAAVALGAFALAVAANIHGHWVASSQRRSLAFALVAWPLITGVPAFVVALLTAIGLSLKRRYP
jgi:hypothetical protein